MQRHYFLTIFCLFAKNWINLSFLRKIWLHLAWFLDLKRSPSMLTSEKKWSANSQKVVNRQKKLVLLDFCTAHRYKKVVKVTSLISKRVIWKFIGRLCQWEDKFLVETICETVPLWEENGYGKPWITHQEESPLFTV